MAFTSSHSTSSPRTFVEFLRAPGQLVIPGLVDRRLVVIAFQAAPQIIGDLHTLVWFELKRRIEDFLRAQHGFSLPRAEAFWVTSLWRSGPAPNYVQVTAASQT